MQSTKFESLHGKCWQVTESTELINFMLKISARVLTMAAEGQPIEPLDKKPHTTMASYIIECIRTAKLSVANLKGVCLVFYCRYGYENRDIYE